MISPYTTFDNSSTIVILDHSEMYPAFALRALATIPARVNSPLDCHFRVCPEQLSE